MGNSDHLITYKHPPANVEDVNPDQSDIVQKILATTNFQARLELIYTNIQYEIGEKL